MSRFILTISAVVAMASGAAACPGGDALNPFVLFFWYIIEGVIAAGGYWH